MQTKYPSSKRTFLYTVFLFFLCLKFYAQSGSESLVVIDSYFSEKTQIITTLTTNEVLLELNNSTNGWKQIREVLQENKSIKTVHLFVNASYNSFMLSGLNYDLNAVKSENELGMLEGVYQGTPLKLLIYNCNLGSSAEGITLINKISQKAYLNIGICTNCTSIYDSNFSFGYSTLNLAITITPITIK